MKILFLSLMYDGRMGLDEYKKKQGGILQGASNTFQYALLDGFFENNFIDDLYVINCLPVSVFPQYRGIFLKKNNFNYKGKHIGITVPTMNIHIFKQYFRYRRVLLEAKKFIKLNRDEKICIITYNVYEPFMKACSKLAEKYSNVVFAPIITDMPGDKGILPNAKWKRNFYLRQEKRVSKCLKAAKKYILLTKYMAEPLNATKENSLIMEGVYSSNIKVDTEYSVPKDKKIIFYSGVIFPKYGTDLLVQAFNSIRQGDVELWMCGEIRNSNNVVKISHEDKRIRLMGFIDRSEVLAIQQKAALLVNPRPIGNEEFVKYSFPSKTMEYLASGTPTLMFKLPGIPDEYNEYLNYVENTDIENMKSKMLKILNDKSGIYKEKAKRGQEFVLSEKTASKQVKRLIDFLTKE